jgi:hypothetical protein
MLFAYIFQKYLIPFLGILLLFAFGFSTGAYYNAKRHTCPIPKPCPPCDRIVYQISLDKIKAKGGSTIDITPTIKDNTTILQLQDTLKKYQEHDEHNSLENTQRKKRGFFGRMFGKREH